MKRVKAGTSKAEARKRRALFIEAMVQNGGNATQAAIAAGYSKHSARRLGTRLSTNVHVSKELQKRRAEVMAAATEKTGLTVEKTLREVARLAYFDMRKLYKPDGSMKQPHELDDDTAAGIAGVEVNEIGVEGTVIGHTKKVKLADKNSALDKAMKHLGLYEKDNAQKPLPPGNVHIHVVGVRARR